MYDMYVIYGGANKIGKLSRVSTYQVQAGVHRSSGNGKSGPHNPSQEHSDVSNGVETHRVTDSRLCNHSIYEPVNSN